MMSMRRIFLFLMVAMLVLTGLTVSKAEEKQLTIPASVVEIQSQVFEGCESAEILTILGVETTIAEDALENSGITTIRSLRAATQVKDYAESHSLAWEPLDPPDILVWAGNAELAMDEISGFLNCYPQYATAKFTVTRRSITEVVGAIEGGERPDIFEMAQDQFYIIRNLGMLNSVPASIEGKIRNRNAAGSVSASEINGTLYAYPLTADNGFFLYYDKSVISDPSSLESILRDCETAGKKFYMQVDSGWYHIAFFFGAGCKLDFSYGEDGSLTSVHVEYANEHGIQAMRSLIQTIGSSSFVNGSSVGGAENWAAIVSGTWDAIAAKAYLGDNYAAAKLPEIDGYQMKSYGGFQMIGVRPQEDTFTQELCHALADWLTDENVQLRRYEELGAGPSNLAAQQNEALQGDEALVALAAQAAYAVPQGQIPGGYWGISTNLVREIMNGDFRNATDDQLLARLQQFEEDIQRLAE